jgi:hypothetical protein
VTASLKAWAAAPPSRPFPAEELLEVMVGQQVEQQADGHTTDGEDGVHLPPEIFEFFVQQKKDFGSARHS